MATFRIGTVRSAATTGVARGGIGTRFFGIIAHEVGFARITRMYRTVSAFACVGSIAVRPVVAWHGIVRVNTSAVRFVARIVSARIVVAAVRRRGGIHQATHACLDAVAEQPVVRVVGVVVAVAATGGRVARIGCTYVPVVASCVGRNVVARIGGLVAGIGRAVNAIVAGDRRSGLAIVQRIAEFAAVAEQAVVTGGVAGHAVAPFVLLVARIHRAKNEVDAADGPPRLAPTGPVAAFRPVAVLAIVA